MFRGDAAHTGVYPGTGPRQFHGVKWRFPTGRRVVSSPAWHDGVLFFASDDGNLYAVDAASGRQKWKYSTQGPAPSSPAVAGGMVYFGSYDGRFYALDEATGDLRWKFRTDGERQFEAKGLHGFQPKNQTFPDPFDMYLSSPVVAQGAVYFGSGDGNAYALDASSGDLKWKFHTNDVIHAAPAYADGTVYIAGWDSFLYALDAATGKEKWRFGGGQDPFVHNQAGFQASPAVAGGLVYVGCRDSNLYAIDAATGKEKWKVNNQGSWVITSPAVVNGKVIFGTSDSRLYQVADAASGKVLVKQEVKGNIFSSPAVAGDTVFYGTLNGMLEARDLASGELLWQYQSELSKRNRGWLLAADGKVNSPLVFNSAFGKDQIVGAAQMLNGGTFMSSPLIVNGVVYVGCADGYLYAIT